MKGVLIIANALSRHRCVDTKAEPDAGRVASRGVRVLTGKANKLHNYIRTFDNSNLDGVMSQVAQRKITQYRSKARVESVDCGLRQEQDERLDYVDASRRQVRSDPLPLAHGLRLDYVYRASTR
jgi:hypothetical protein